MANEFVARNGIIALNNSTVTGSLDVTTRVTSPSFTGSLYGTASNVQGGSQYSVPVWTGASTLGTSSLYESASVLKTIYNASDVGLKLDFSSSKFILGDDPNGLGFVYDAPNQLYYFGDYGQNGNTIEYNSSTGIITTNYGFVNNGLRFEMSNGIYELGQLTGGNQTKLTIDDATQTVAITGSVAVTGLSAGTGSGDVLMYNTSSGQFFYTASSAIGGGGNASNDNFQQIFLLMGG